jgi:hypothetical protein
MLVVTSIISMAQSVEYNVLGQNSDDRLHNFQVSSCNLMKNIKVRYFAFVSLLLSLFATANRIKKIEDFTQPQSFNSPLNTDFSQLK